MFEELERELRRLGGRQTISVSLPSDEDGYFDRECPSTECGFEFKIHEDDWRQGSRRGSVLPVLPSRGESDSWWTEEQIKHAERVAASRIEGDIADAMRRDAERWNRRQPRQSFISMTMHVNERPRPVPVPPAAEAMRLKIGCPECKCCYTVVGAAFFCPACGHNAADQVFSQSTTAIVNALGLLDGIRKAAPDQDTAETTARLLIENGLLQAVTAFQRFAEALYGRYPSAPTSRRNAFQSLADGSDLWFAATGRRYSDHLTPSELDAMTRHFQRRHLIAHTQGIVDEDYIRKTGDTTYRVGQRLVIRESSLRDCVALIKKLAGCMESDDLSTKETKVQARVEAEEAERAAIASSIAAVSTGSTDVAMLRGRPASTARNGRQSSGETGNAFVAVLDAPLAAGPVAKAHLEHRTPLSFHGYWLART